MTLKFVNGKSQQTQTCVATTNSRPRLVCYTTVRFEENAYEFFFRGQGAGANKVCYGRWQTANYT